MNEDSAQTLQPSQETPVTSGSDNISSPPPENPDYPEYSGFSLFSLKNLGIAAVVIFLVLLIVLGIIFISRFLSPTKQEKATLTYWGVWEDQTAFSGIINDFEQKHPNITVKYEKQDIKTLGNYVSRLQTRINNGTGPDIFRFHNSWFLELKKYLHPLPSDLLKSVDFNNDYYSVTKEDMSSQGAVYGIPLDMDTLSLFVNTDIFAKGGYKIPTNWDDMIDVARQITVKDPDGKIKTAGVALGTYGNVSHASDIISLLFIQNGVNPYDLSSGTAKAAESLDYYTYFARGDGKVWDDSIDNSLLSFIKGNLAMYFGYSWDIFQIKAANPNLNFKVVPVPHLENRNYTVASYWSEGISSKTKYPDAAVEFLKFLSQKDTLERLYTAEAKSPGRGFGELYPRLSMQSSLKQNQLIFPFVQQAQDAKSTPFSSDTYDDAMNNKLNVYLENAVNSVVNGSSSPESAAETLVSGQQSVFSQYAQ